ncbi:hypothetical protein DFJ73DRAFT_765479 [Zopfochytrium polystomum]|nr:hypothetical protein DFJ73DRAFT_765479 [Zopfochytrium polystomum]
MTTTDDDVDAGGATSPSAAAAALSTVRATTPTPTPTAASSATSLLLQGKAATLANLLSHLAASAPVPSVTQAVADASASSTEPDAAADAEAAQAAPAAAALPQGLDVLLAEIVILAEKVKAENDELVDKLRLSRDAQDELAVDFRTMQGKMLAIQDKMEHSLRATASIEAALANKVVETEGLKKEARAITRERDELKRRLESEVGKSLTMTRSRTDLKTETKLMDQQLQEARTVEDTGNAELDAAKLEAKNMEEKLNQSLHQLAESVSKRLNSLEDERVQLRTELSDLQEQLTALMEENESYQLLLQQQTLSGEFMASSIMKGDRRTSLALASSAAMSHSLFDELDGNTGEAARAAATALMDENKTLQGEISALTAYINKVLNDTRLLDALSMLHDMENSNNLRTHGLTTQYRSPNSSARTASGLRTASTSGPSLTAASVAAAAVAGSSGLHPRSSSLKQRLGGGGSFSVGRRPGPILTTIVADEDGRVVATSGPMSAAPALGGPGLGGGRRVEGPRSALVGESMTLISVDTSSAVASGMGGGGAAGSAGVSTPTWSGYFKRSLDTLVGALSPGILDDGVKKELPDVSGSVKKDSA